MAEIGKYNTLVINRFVDFGAFLDAGDGEEILMPEKYMTGEEQEGDEVDVFVYLDSEERPVATTEIAAATVGNIGAMTVSRVTEFGAFMDWGINKELFIPFQEQREELKEGTKHLVYVYIDELTYRLAGSTKIEKYIDGVATDFEEGQEVRLLIYRNNPIGYEALVNENMLGMIYQNEIFSPIAVGDSTVGYVKKIREDGKLDIALQPQGYEHVEDFSDVLLRYIVENGGKSSFHDKSSPDEIKKTFGVSKKIFKKATGKLYKEGKIILVNKGIELVDND